MKRKKHSEAEPLEVGEIVLFRGLTLDQQKHYGISNGTAGEVRERWLPITGRSGRYYGAWTVLVLPLVPLRSGRPRVPFRLHRARVTKLAPIEQLAIMGV